MELTNTFIVKILAYTIYFSSGVDEAMHLLRKCVDFGILKEQNNLLFPMLEKAIILKFNGADPFVIEQDLYNSFKDKYKKVHNFIIQKRLNISLNINQNDITILNNFIKEKLTERFLSNIAEYLQETQDAIDYQKISSEIFLFSNNLTELKKTFNEIRLYDVNEVINILTEPNKVKISSGFDNIDKVLGGGIGAGRLVFWSAATGVGKSMFMLHAGKKNFEEGKNVLYITLENTIDETIVRLLSSITDIPMQDLPQNIDEVKKHYNAYINKYKEKGGNFILKFMPTKTSIDEILFYIKSLEYKFDLVIIDYLDLIKPPTYLLKETSWNRLNEMCIILKGVASENSFVIYTASQMNREGYDNDNSNIQHVAGSWGKVSNSDLFFILRQTKNMYHNNKIDIVLGKSRISHKNLILRCSFDPSTMHIEEESLREDLGKQKTKQDVVENDIDTRELPF